MMSEMKEGVRVMVVREDSCVAMRGRPHQRHVACLTFGQRCLTLLMLIVVRVVAIKNVLKFMADTDVKEFVNKMIMVGQTVPFSCSITSV